MTRRIGETQYQALVADAQVLQQENYGVKVWLLPDGRVLKLFLVRRRISSARLVSYAARFERNARRLRRRGIRAPEVLDRFYCAAIGRHGVVYRRLPGEPLEKLLEKGADEGLLRRFAVFLSELHDKGIYFRSVHPGNVLLMDDGGFGLIDVQDVRFRPWPLGAGLRARNFRHLFGSRDHSSGLRAFGWERFADLYLDALPPARRRRLAPRLARAGRKQT